MLLSEPSTGLRRSEFRRVLPAPAPVRGGRGDVSLGPGDVRSGLPLGPGDVRSGLPLGPGDVRSGLSQTAGRPVLSGRGSEHMCGGRRAGPPTGRRRWQSIQPGPPATAPGRRHPAGCRAGIRDMGGGISWQHGVSDVGHGSMGLGQEKRKARTGRQDAKPRRNIELGREFIRAPRYETLRIGPQVTGQKQR